MTTPTPKPAMEARLTEFWGNVGADLRLALESLLDDDDFYRLFLAAIGFSVGIRELHRRDAAAYDHLSRQAAQEELLPALTRAALSASPRLGHILGEHRLGDFLAGLVADAATHCLHGTKPTPHLLKAMALTTLLHLPGNPLALLDADGSLVAGADAAEPQHLLQLAAYKRSLRPASIRGRKKGTPKPKGSGKRTNWAEVELCRDLEGQGLSDKEIITAVWPDLGPLSSAGRARLRSRRWHYHALPPKLRDS